jgi:NAD(P)-dependent dehydrogenase (short-subunit alcohol dehydrogenase family)
MAGNHRKKLKIWRILPAGTVGSSTEVAPMYVTMAFNESSYILGQFWCSDGGTGTP